MSADEEIVDSGSETEEVVDTSAVEQADSSAEAPEQGVSSAPATGEVWGAFRQLPQFQGADDQAIASRLYEALQREQAATHALQQYQSIIPVASEYLSKKDMFEKWVASQNQPQSQQVPQQAAAPQQDASWWNPPKVKDIYRQYLTRDENGREIVDPNAPLEARHELMAYQAYKANFAQKFLENPEQTLGPMVERVAIDRAQAIVDQRLQRMNDENYVSNLEKENADWLYDGNGNASPEGLLAQKYIQDARSMGIQGAKARWEFATRMVERDLLLSNLRQSQQAQQPMQQALPAVAATPSPADAAAARNMEYLRQQAMRTASQRPAQASDPRAPKKSMSFADKLAANLQGEGLA